jgi:hypothetical protein
MIQLTYDDAILLKAMIDVMDKEKPFSVLLEGLLLS